MRIQLPLDGVEYRWGGFQFLIAKHVLTDELDIWLTRGSNVLFRPRAARWSNRHHQLILDYQAPTGHGMVLHGGLIGTLPNPVLDRDEDHIVAYLRATPDTIRVRGATTYFDHGRLLVQDRPYPDPVLSWSWKQTGPSRVEIDYPDLVAHRALHDLLEPKVVHRCVPTGEDHRLGS